MPVFAIEAIDSSGQKVKKEIDATSKDAAIKQIRSDGLRPTRISMKARSAAKADEKKKKKGFVLFDRIKQTQVVTFTTQLSTLQDAGLPIVRSLKILAEQQKPGKFKDALEAIGDDVEQGSTFSEALSKFPKAFDKLYVSMVKAGEAGGVLDVILNRLATFMEKAERIKKKVKGALTYPIAVIIVAILIVTCIMIYVVPSFEKMFKDLGQALPAPTQFLLTTSELVTTYWYLLPGVPFGIWVIVKWIARTDRGRIAIDRLKLNVPVFGMIIKKSSISRFCRTLGTLIASGVPILEALRIVKDAVGNVMIANAIEEVHGSIREGDTVAEPLRNSGVFDELLINMIDVGEETGELDKMLIKIADNYEADVDVAVESVSALIEPLIIVGLGGVVGFIVVSLFLPLIEIIKSIN
jgi:type IV pilus assembly protein PilC